MDLKVFVEKVTAEGQRLYRDLPWRNDRNPYGVWLSEVMLQQTQVSRVMDYWQRWLEEFPTIFDLAEAPTDRVLQLWQGLGYNRRCLALKRAAEEVCTEYGGRLPISHDELLALPGIGPATAAGIRVFAFGQPDMYLETNVRTVFLHELFPGQTGVSDKQLVELVAACCPTDDPASWYYALLDYGAYLKKTVPNPSRRSAQHTRQSKFEGSRRQKRAWLTRAIMATSGQTTEQLLVALNEEEEAAGREQVDLDILASILADLEAEGFVVCEEGHWRVA